MTRLRRFSFVISAILVLVSLVVVVSRFYFAQNGDAGKSKLVSISVSPPLTSLQVKAQQSFKATGNYVDGSQQDLTSKVTWTSSASDVVRAEPGGIANGLRVGRARVMAELESQGGGADVFVGPTVLVGIAISPSGASIQRGKNVSFHATGTYSDGTSSDLTKVVAWSSSATDVAVIEPNGLAMGKQVAFTASTAIRAAMDGVSSATFLTVTPHENGFAGVLTYHNDLSRTGQNLNEVALKPSNVRSTEFGKLFSIKVDGYVYAQPLYAPKVSVPGKGDRNLVFVATENNSVYAFDAENPKGETIWSAQLGPAVPYEKQAPGNCTGIEPTIGITSTPVIDPATNTIYVVARTLEQGNKFYHKLHALDLTTGAEKPGSPVAIAGDAPGTAKGSKGGRVVFDPSLELQRPGLTLVNGQIYAEFGSNCDYGDFHGWIFGFDAPTLKQTAVFLTTPTGTDGGIWASGAPPVADTDNHLFVITGDGTFNIDSGGSDYGDTFLKISVANKQIAPVDYFAPNNQKKLDDVDLDLGSGGGMALPDQISAHPHLITGGGKEGTIYVLDRDNLGHIHSGSNAQIVQCLTSAVNPVFSTPAYWQDKSESWIYYGASLSTLKAYLVEKGQLSPMPSSQSVERFGSPGSGPVISANGNKDGIVWILGRDIGDRSMGVRDYSARIFNIATHPKALWPFLGRIFHAVFHPSMWHNYFTRKLPVSHTGLGQPVLLRAYDATDLATLLYSSDQAPNNRDQADLPVKFAVPIVANGRVYFGTQDHLDVYGLLK